ncbi:acetyl-CoA acetyltransferase [Sphingomonas mali]|uniref:acetyl-CoA acetyltransferase n=1 Tax=Sphingomonas mali TaxID=40682 RepID=UPI000836016F|nr:acetyl-CoA acetyltransferase [Sphingomonas mali]
MKPEHIPVIVGVGQFNDRPEDPAEGRDSLGLMEEALRVAERDAGGGSWLSGLDSIGIVDQISFKALGNLTGPLAERIGASPRFAEQTALPSGTSPIELLNIAANRIGAGEIRSAAICGGEALRTAARRAAAAAGTASHNVVRTRLEANKPGYAQRYGLVAPIDVYPLYENAARSRYGQDLAAGQEETGEIWARFSEVAAANEGAWIRRNRSAEEIVTPTADNRPLAFPYTKLMVANSSVNQGAAFIVTSLAEARARGIPEERLVFVGLGAAAREDDQPIRRDRFDRSVSMYVSLVRALSLNGLAARDIDMVELYSCFPCVPKMARRVLGWPVARPATVFGGLTFGGGPIGNYMSHAVVSMVERLRHEGRYGLLFANGGFATHNHSIVLSSRAITAATFPQDFNYQAEAEALRDPVPAVDEDYTGPATIETYTVFHARDGEPSGGVIVARTPGGYRTLAGVHAGDRAVLDLLLSGAPEVIGHAGTIERHADGGQIWRELAAVEQDRVVSA